MTEQSAKGLPKLKIDEWDLVRDIYIPLETSGQGGMRIEEASFNKAFCYLGDPVPRALWDETNPAVMEKAQNLYLEVSRAQESQSRQAFRLNIGENRFRAHREMTDGGMRLVLRVLPSETPHLSQLQMPHAVRTLLMDPDLLYGGLVLLTATNGQGKTTTASAAVRSRLELYGGKANTVEDPPELPLQGFHGKGHCDQLPVDPEDPNKPGSEYALKLRSSLRMFPAIPGTTTLFVGEIRDAETAAETLLAASAGHFVIATAFGHSVMGALTRLITMASERLGSLSANDHMARSLKACIFQRLTLKREGEGWDRGEVRAEVLWNPKPEHRIAEAIRTGNFAALSKAVDAQRQAMQTIPNDAQPHVVKQKLAEVSFG